MFTLYPLALLEAELSVRMQVTFNLSPHVWLHTALV